MKAVLKALAEFFMAPIAWISILIFEPFIRLLPIWYETMLQYTSKDSALYDWLGEFAICSSEGQGARLRRAYYQSRLKKIGVNPAFLPQVRLAHPHRIMLGDNVAINYFTVIVALGDVTIGNDVLIGPYVLIHSGNHQYADSTVVIRRQGHDIRPVFIEDDVWIGAHAVILPGTRIGKGSVVAAGAVVTKDVEPYSVVAGVPARRISERN